MKKLISLLLAIVLMMTVLPVLAETDSADRAAAVQTKINDQDYAKADAAEQRGDLQTALTGFTALGAYRDSADRAAAVQTKINDQDYAKADAAEQRGDLQTALTGITAGDILVYGNYPQTANGETAPVEWIVLERDGNKALLISKYGLDAKPYNTKWENITWEKCTLRKWLNSDFLNAAFTKEEQKAILKTKVSNAKNQGYSGWNIKGGSDTQDQIFLLSYAEANKYFGVTYDDSNNTKARVQPTAYAIAQGANTISSDKTAEGEPAGYWWLRSPGGTRYDAALVGTGGSLGYTDVDYSVYFDDYHVVRPALWVDLESGIF